MEQIITKLPAGVTFEVECLYKEIGDKAVYYVCEYCGGTGKLTGYGEIPEKICPECGGHGTR